jgi:ABC-2 type transport system ATP-binding protein
VLINSHLLGELERVCDRVVILSGGRVVAAGRPEKLTRTGGVEIQTGAGVRRFPNTARKDIPRIVAELVAEGVDIYEVSESRSTLEDVYLEPLERG